MTDIESSFLEDVLATGNPGSREILRSRRINTFRAWRDATEECRNFCRQHFGDDQYLKAVVAHFGITSVKELAWSLERGEFKKAYGVSWKRINVIRQVCKDLVPLPKTVKKSQMDLIKEVIKLVDRTPGTKAYKIKMTHDMSRIFRCLHDVGHIRDCPVFSLRAANVLVPIIEGIIENGESK